MAGCLCKRGKCKTCKTMCPRCQCTCDGIDIALKMSNVRGKHLPKTPPPVRPKRAAATDAAKAITKQTAVMDVDEPLEQGMGLGYRSLRNAFQLFGIPESAYRALPSAAARKDASLATSDSEGFGRMARPASKVIADFAHMLYPGNPAALVGAAFIRAKRLLQNAEAREQGEQDELEDEAGEQDEAGGQDEAGEQDETGEQDEGDEAGGQDDDVEADGQEVSEAGERDEEQQPGPSKAEQLQARAWKVEAGMDVLKGVIEASMKGSKEARVGRAIASAFGKRVLEITGITMGKKALDLARKDRESLLRGAGIEETIYSRTRFNTETLERAVDFIVSPSNVGMLSWGEKVVELSPYERVVLPSLRRRKTMLDLYRSYINVHNDKAGRLGRTSFYELAAAITSRGERMLTAVDYVTGVLVNDTVELLQTISDDFEPDAERRQQLTNDLELVGHFLRHQYDEHALCNDDEVPTHGIAFGLGLAPQSEGEQRAGRCNACVFPFFHLDQVWSVIDRCETKTQDSKDDAKMVVGDIAHKWRLYMGHRVRVVNQQHAIETRVAEMKAQCVRRKKGDRALMTIDWKMKVRGSGSWRRAAGGEY